MHLSRTAVLIALALASAACGDTVAPEPGEPTTMQLLRGGEQTGTPGVALDSMIVVRVQDSRGTGIGGVAVRFVVVTGGGSIQPTEAITAPDGTAQAEWVLGDLVFTAQRAAALVLRPGAAPIEAAITATATPTGPVAIVPSVAPAVLAPGATMTVAGDSLQHVTAVTVAGLHATITAQSPTSLSARIRADGYDCLPTGAVPIVLTSDAGRVQHLQQMMVAAERDIAVGDVVTSSPADPLTCIELPAEGGRYVIAVANVAQDPASIVGVRLRGLGTGSGANAAAVNAAAPEAGPAADVPALPTGRSVHHNRLLRDGAAVTAGSRAGPNALAVTAVRADPVVGDTVTVRVPRLTASGNLCNAYDQVLTRVAHVSERTIVMEDVTHPFAGALTEYYRDLAGEYDALQFPVLEDNFAAPPGTDERLRIVFTRRVNGYDVSGFVWAGDLMPRSSCEQSNEGPVFYGFVPTVVGDEYAAGTRTEWWWTIRPTLVHEAKHLTSMAYRFAAGLPQHELWIEEATAMVAEELWARRVFGYVQRGNVSFAASVGCEIAGAFGRAPCVGKPGALFAHYLFLAGWLAQPGSNSVLGPVAIDDLSFYGSSWLFLRWLLDHADRDEAALLRELTAAPQPGVAAIETTFGRPFAALLPEWAAAVAIDDRSNVTPTAGYDVPSWNLRDVYSGLNREQPNLFPTTFPLRIRALSYGTTQTDVPVVRGGGAVYFELSGDPVGRQALAFSGARGAPLPAQLRIVIVRID
ncbi:hypothetical protein BH23GEM10_BH23GEM10_11230 [soil metagenome]